MQSRPITAVDAGSSSTTGIGGQTIVTGTPTVGSTVPVMCAQNPPYPGGTVVISGTFTATVVVETSYDGGTTWNQTIMIPVGETTPVTSITGPGTIIADIDGVTNFRVRCTSFSSGPVNVSLSPGVPLDLPNPTPLIQLRPGQTTMDLIWAPVVGATSYDIWRGTSTGTETLLHAANSGNTFHDTGLSPNTAYFYYIVTASVTGKSAASAEATTLTLPGPPTSLGATPAAASIALSWSAPSGGASTYRVYRGTAAGQESTNHLATDITGTTYTDTMANTGGVIGTTYFYVVKAINSTLGISAASNEVSSASTGQAAPTSVAATPGSASNVITWVAAAGAVTYNLYRGTATGAESPAPIKTGLTGTTVTDSSLDASKTYFYNMTALSTAGQSVKSNETSGQPIPLPPTVVSAAVASTSSIKITWTAAVGAATYNLYRGTTPGGESGTPVQTGLTGTTFTDTGLSAGTYYYRMKSVNPSGTSTTYSNETHTAIGVINLVFGGDSRFAANGPVAPNQVFNIAKTFLTGETATNTAVNSRGWLDNSNGGSTLGVISQFATEVLPLFDATKLNIWCVACDVNDYAFWSIQQVAGAAYTGVQLGKASGFGVMLNGPIDAVGGVDNTPPKQWHSVDRAVLQNYYVTSNTVGADTPLDTFGNVSVLDDASNNTNFADGVHPTIAASTAWGNYLGPLINVNPGRTAALASHTIFQDTFADTNGVLLTAHVPTDGTNPTGTPWIEDGTGAYTIQSNKAQASVVDVTNGFALAAAEVGSTDVLISVVANLGTSTNNVGLVARHGSATAFWLVVINPNGLYILECTGVSTFVTRNVASHTFNTSTDYTLTLQTKGAVIQATADGITVTFPNMLTNLTKTQCGIYADVAVHSQTFDTYSLAVNAPLTGPFTIANDTFTGTNGTNLTAHVMNMGLGWTAGNGVFQIQSNRAQATTLTTGSAIYATDVGIKDYTISGTVNGSTAGRAGFIFRYTDASNYWIALPDMTGSNGVEIVRVVSGSATAPAHTAATLAASTDYTLTVVVSGTSVTATLSGGGLGSPVVCNYSGLDTGLTTTKIGLYVDGATGANMDSLVVTNP